MDCQYFSHSEICFFLIFYMVTKDFNSEVEFISSFYGPWFRLKFKIFWQSLGCNDIFLCFSKSVTVLHLNLWSILNLFVYEVWDLGQGLVFLLVDVHLLCTICWEGYPSSIGLLLLFCPKLVRHSYMFWVLDVVLLIYICPSTNTL